MPLKDKITSKEYYKKLREDRNAAGLCKCGRPQAANRKSCRKCIARLSKSNADKCAIRDSMGLCVRCGGARDGDTKTCTKCLSVFKSIRLQNKISAIDGYGGRCSCCGESNYLFLAIDHVNNDGSNKRKSGEDTSDKLYRKVVNLNFPPEYQVLCHNCNIGKYLNGGVCPHKI